jgi:hypothetical protein
LNDSSDEAVVDEDILVDIEIDIVSFEIAGAITGDAVPKRQILRSRRSPDRIRLNESEYLERPRERRWAEQASRDRIAADPVEVARHPAIISSAPLPKRVEIRAGEDD